MSIQRWYIQNPPGQPTEFVSYADHVAAVTDAENAVRNEIQQRINTMPTVAWNEEWYARGKRDERARIYQAVEALIDDGREYQAVMLRGVLSIIDGDSDV